jgi:hypothetical protein
MNPSAQLPLCNFKVFTLLLWPPGTSLSLGSECFWHGYLSFYSSISRRPGSWALGFHLSGENGCSSVWRAWI